MFLFVLFMFFLWFVVWFITNIYLQAFTFNLYLFVTMFFFIGHKSLNHPKVLKIKTTTWELPEKAY